MTMMTTAPPSNKNNTDDDGSTSVQVAVRVRPMLASEMGSTQCVEVLQQNKAVDATTTSTTIVRIGGTSGPTFTFDEAFSNTTTQYDVFRRRVAPLLTACLEGYNATVLAYGQTGSGKTYTIMGDDANNGVIPRALRSLFQQLEAIKQERLGNKENCCQSHPHQLNGGEDSDSDDTSSACYNFNVRVQFLELYGEEIRDLLSTTSSSATSSSNKLTIRDVGMDEPEVLGASQQKVHSAEEALLCLTRGMLRRVTGATAMNASSSRSHAILSVLVEQTSTLEEEEGPDSVSQPRVEVKRSKFSFVDLAGSERQKRTQAEGQRLKEGIDINKGLLVLGNVISALGDPKKMGKTFVPYRDSKLTRLLKGSLGGNHKTLMIACLSPSSNNFEESLNCLRYANRAKNIQNNAIINVDAGSRLVAELRSQIKMLATELLCFREGRETEGTLAMDVLKTLASGGEANLLTSPRPTPYRGTQRTTALGSPAGAYHTSTERTKEIEEERDLLQSKLRMAESEKVLTAEALHATKAEREMYRLQLEMTSNGDVVRSDDKEDTFLKRATAYEREIASLKESLRTAKAHNDIDGGTSTPSSKRSREKSLSVIDKANLVLSEEKAQLISLQKKLIQSPVRSLSKELASVQISEADQLDAEENAEIEELSAITKKFLPDEADVDEGEDAEPADGSDQNTLIDEEATEASMRHRQQMEAQLYEISRSIEAKEELIEQLQISQEKYAAMREFYEEKLQQMEEQVQARESEREQLVHELARLEESNGCTQDLQARLSAKEEHIAGLRKKQRELVGLTKVSSRNESEIARLRHDVVHMKQKKVELQKLVTNERKLHANEIRRLKKEAMQRDREASKWKRVSQQKAVEAERAQMVAKSRLEQVGQLRAKYKEAEKKLRVKTVKQGVMKKAGLDPVLVGRTMRKENRDAHINHDAMRDLFDEKVAEVGRKEVLADKVAHEWEEHLELVTQKEELQTLSRDSRTESLSDAVNALDVQVKYKEERIRQLSRRLGKSPSVTVPSPSAPDSAELSFLDEDAFKATCLDKSPLVATREAAKVLFGMVVRERRRVAALARTASSLDEKVYEAEKEAASKDAAFRSHVEEARRDREELEQSHQERLLSLMEMVKEEMEQRSLPPVGEEIVEPEETGRESAGPAFNTRSRLKVLLLANERIAILERQVEELKGAKATGDMYKRKEEDTRALLLAKESECENLEKQIDRLRTSLRQIRDTSTKRSPVPAKNASTTAPSSEEDEKSREIFSIAMDALHPSCRSPRGRAQSKNHSSGSGSGSDSRPPLLSPRLKRHVELMHASDSEDDENVPEWAGDILADLEIIAKGEAPPAILDSPGVKEMSETGIAARPKPTSGADSVFDRLTHPDNFTGVQKQRTVRQKRIKSAPAPENTQSAAFADATKSAKVASSQTGGDKGRRQAISRLVAEQLESIVAPEAPGGTTSSDTSVVSPTEGRQSDASDETSHRRSVFDRLLSPSNYTGTQKERLQRTRKKKRRGVAAQARKPEESRGSNTEADDKGSPMAAEEIMPSESPTTARPAKKAADYTQQDVFERLQTTTTQSYAVKQHAPTARAPSETRQSSATHDDSIASPRHSVESSISSTPPTIVGEASSNYTKQDVFERLQKTTTQAYAKKTSKISNDEP